MQYVTIVVRISLVKCLSCIINHGSHEKCQINYDFIGIDTSMVYRKLHLDLILYKDEYFRVAIETKKYT